MFGSLQGHRLGTVGETSSRYGADGANNQRSRPEDNLPAPTYDPNLNAQERTELRAARAAAAEERMKQSGVPKAKKKPKPSSSEPLRGPNSQNMMRWTASG